ncbi:MAG: glycerol-3-phosphate dehydrogenase C-terminal domain-containing protein, partial [Ilumatobacteraceae bacterium]
MATTLEDVMTRRTRAHLFDRPAAVLAAPAVADLLAGELGWDDAETARQLDAYRQLAGAEAREATVVATMPR